MDPQHTRVSIRLPSPWENFLWTLSARNKLQRLKTGSALYVTWIADRQRNCFYAATSIFLLGSPVLNQGRTMDFISPNKKDRWTDCAVPVNATGSQMDVDNEWYRDKEGHESYNKHKTALALRRKTREDGSVLRGTARKLYRQRLFTSGILYRLVSIHSLGTVIPLPIFFYFVLLRYTFG